MIGIAFRRDPGTFVKRIVADLGFDVPIAEDQDRRFNRRHP